MFLKDVLIDQVQCLWNRHLCNFLRIFISWYDSIMKCRQPYVIFWFEFSSDAYLLWLLAIILIQITLFTEDLNHPGTPSTIFQPLCTLLLSIHHYRKNWRSRNCSPRMTCPYYMSFLALTFVLIVFNVMYPWNSMLWIKPKYHISKAARHLHEASVEVSTSEP